MIASFLRILTIAILPALLLISGCARSPQPNFYMLASQEVNASGIHENGKGPKIAVAVTIPAYLDRLQIVVRRGNSVDIKPADMHQWSEPLPDGIARVLCDHLAASLPSGLVFPMRAALPAEWRLAVDLSRLDGAPENESVLDVWWSLAPMSDEPSNNISASGRFSTKITADATMEGLARAESTLIDRLGEKLAAEIIAKCFGKRREKEK